MTADAPGRVGRRTGATGTFGTAAIRRRLAANRDFGPFDAADLDPSLPGPPGLLDFGSVRVPVPPEGTVTVEPTANGRLQAVHVTLPGGRLSVSALAAPKSAGLWAELVAEIDASLRDGGARVRSFRGDWGRELHARTGAATSVFVGVDGARWMLYGVATGPERHAVDLEASLRQMLKGTVVDRGRSPFPVRTVLPLTVPDGLADVVDDPAAAAPVPARADAPVEPQRAHSPAVVGPAVVPPGAVPSPAAPPLAAPVGPAARPRSAPPRRPSTPMRPAAASPPPVDLPPVVRPVADRAQAAADPVEAGWAGDHTASRPLPEHPLAGAPRAEPPAPLWATRADELRTTDPGRSDLGPPALGPDPAADVGTDAYPAADAPVTGWWPAAHPVRADPDPLAGPWVPSGWVADTPLHDELATPATEHWAAVDVEHRGPTGYADGPGQDRIRRAVEPEPLEQPVTEQPAALQARTEQVDPQVWPVVPAAGGAGRTARHAAPADAAPRAGRRRRAESPDAETGGSTLDLAALVRDRPGHRHSRSGPGTAPWDRSPFARVDGTGDHPITAAAGGPGLWGDDPRDATAGDDDRWGAENHGLPGRGDGPAGPDVPRRGRPVGGHRNWDRSADPSATHRSATHGSATHGSADDGSADDGSADDGSADDRSADDRYPADDQGVDLWSTASTGAAPSPAPNDTGLRPDHPRPDRPAGGRRRRLEPADPYPPDPDGAAATPDTPRSPRGRVSEPTTDPLPVVPADLPARRRRRGVDVPADPDRMLPGSRTRDGSEPASPAGSGSRPEPEPPAGRHHRPR